MQPSTRLFTAAALAGLLAAGSSPAKAQSVDARATIEHAVGTLQDLQHDQEFGTAKQLMRTAKAIMIAPRIFRAGFFFGGEGGSAVLLARGPHGFSDPAFMTIASASFGLQIGAQQSEMIVFIMSDRALQAVLRDRFKIGADAGFAIATLGSLAGGGTTANVGADMITWASSSGAYAGVSLNGTLIEPDLGEDRAFYGQAVTTPQIVERRAVRTAGAGTLTRMVDSLGA